MIESELSQNQTLDRLEPTVGYWGLDRNPFLDRSSTFVATPTHHEAMVRLADLIESKEPLGILAGESGMGKTNLLSQLSRWLRKPSRRFVQVPCPLDGQHLISTVIEGFGRTTSNSARLKVGDVGASSWRTLEQGLRIQGLQKTEVVVIIDDCRNLTSATEVQYLKRLLDLRGSSNSLLTVILSTNEEASLREHSGLGDVLPIRLKRLTRSEAGAYIAEKVRLSGRNDEVFSPQAISRIHAQSDGIPRLIDRLSALSLHRAATQGQKMVTPEIVEVVSDEFTRAVSTLPVWIRAADSC